MSRAIGATCQPSKKFTDDDQNLLPYVHLGLVRFVVAVSSVSKCRQTRKMCGKKQCTSDPPSREESRVSLPLAAPLVQDISLERSLASSLCRVP